MDFINQKYQIIEKYRGKADGAYYRGFNQAADKEVYLKLIPVNDDSFSARKLIALQMTAQSHSRFQHTNAIPFYPPEVGEDGLVLSQNFVPGQALSEVFKGEGRPLPEDQAVRTTYAISSALAALHDLQIVHGELTSSHVLISTSGESYLSFLAYPNDYDTKIALYQPQTGRKEPEPTASDDIYAMGVLLAECFTSLIPYGVSGQHTDKKSGGAYDYYKAGLADVTGETARAFAPVILRCLEPEPDQRYASGIDLFIDIRKIVEQWANANPLQGVPAVLPVIEKPIDKKSENFEKTLKPGTVVKQTGAKRPEKKARKKGSVLLSFIAAMAVIALAVILFRYFANYGAGSDGQTNLQKTLAQLNTTQTALASQPSATETSAPTATPGNIAITWPTAALASGTITAIPETILETTATPVPTRTVQIFPITHEIGSAVTWQADNKTMVFVPEGSFRMGIDSSFGFDLANLIPSHSVQLDAFWIDQTEVTREQYNRCVADGKCPNAAIGDEAQENLRYPVSGIAWTDANAYCQWAGKRLPTEAEWEKAARGTDGRLYPWGSNSLNYTAPDGWYPAAVQDVGSFLTDISPYGAVDMGGNVSEWVSDFFEPTVVISAERQNPVGPVSGGMRTVKGGSALGGEPERSFLLFNRWGADPLRPQEYGFRCALSDTNMNDEKANGLGSPVKFAAMGTAPATDLNCTNRIGFVEDVTIPDGTVVKAGENVTKTWKLRNIGTCTVTGNYKIVWMDQAMQNPQKLFDFGTVIAPNQIGEVSISFPAVGNGSTKILFEFADANGNVFGLGERGRSDFWIEYVVE